MRADEEQDADIFGEIKEHGKQGQEVEVLCGFVLLMSGFKE